MDYAILGTVAAAVLVLTAIQARTDAAVFRPFFGRVPPVAAVAIVTLLGFAALGALDRLDWFEIIGPGPAGGAVVFALAAAPPLAGIAIAIDVTVRYPEDLNVRWPQSLSFYPVMGFTADVVMHVVPIALLVAVFGRSDGAVGRLFWFLAVPVALIEAIFQAGAARPRLRLAVPTGLHVFGFALVQFVVLREWGFIPMYGFRLAYYALWHLAWGEYRVRRFS